MEEWGQGKQKGVTWGGRTRRMQGEETAVGMEK